jgi:polygalacturonase
MKPWKIFLAGAAAAMLVVRTAGAGEARYDIRDFGARGDGHTLCTSAIQKAVDACAAQGGGTVYCGPGVWLTGTITLKSHVGFYLDNGCTLLGSTNAVDYPAWHAKLRSYTDNYVQQSLFAGEGLEQVSIAGRGTIDGNGQAFQWKEYLTRPYVIRLVSCTNVVMEGIELRNSPMWMQHYLACHQLVVKGLRVFNHASRNNDGLDIDACSDVTVSDCMIDSDDDAICLKATLDRPCENVVINNCVISSHCSAIKTGTESNGGFRNITINSCTIVAPRFTQSIYGERLSRGIAGIAIETVDGGQSENINISNITIRGVCVPIFIRLGNRARPFTADGAKPGPGALRRVTLTNITASGAATNGCSITGLPESPLEDVLLDNIQLSFVGGGQRKQTARGVNEYPTRYPEATMFGTLPAYGFFCRHVRGLKFSNVRIATEAPDERHALVCDDVTTLALHGVEAGSRGAAAPAFLFRNVADAMVQGCRAGATNTAALRLEGAATKNISVGESEVFAQRIEHDDKVPAVVLGSLSSGAKHAPPGHE